MARAEARSDGNCSIVRSIASSIRTIRPRIVPKLRSGASGVDATPACKPHFGGAQGRPAFRWAGLSRCLVEASESRHRHGSGFPRFQIRSAFYFLSSFYRMAGASRRTPWAPYLGTRDGQGGMSHLGERTGAAALLVAARASSSALVWIVLFLRSIPGEHRRESRSPLFLVSAPIGCQSFPLEEEVESWRRSSLSTAPRRVIPGP